MPMVNVSEKTLDELKDFKDNEGFKSLNGAIRYLLKNPELKTEIESAGTWPTSAINDINHARVKLETKMRFPVSLTARVYLSSRLRKSLDRQLTNTEITFRQFLIKNNLAIFYEWEYTEDDIAIVRSENHQVTIKNIKLS